jgi:hypothetical protein
MCTSRTTHETTELFSSLKYSLNQPLGIDCLGTTGNSGFQSNNNGVAEQKMTVPGKEPEF